MGGDSLLLQWASHRGGSIAQITYTKYNYGTTRLAYHSMHISRNAPVVNTARSQHRHDIVMKTVSNKIKFFKN